MNKTNLSLKRLLTFLCICIFLRSILVVIAYYLSKFKSQILYKIMGFTVFCIGISFWYLFIFGNEIADTQTKVWGDDRIWWNNLRPVHGTLFIIFGLLAIFSSFEYSWTILLLDVIIGLIAWIIHHEIYNFPQLN